MDIQHTHTTTGILVSIIFDKYIQDITTNEWSSIFSQLHTTVKVVGNCSHVTIVCNGLHYSLGKDYISNVIVLFNVGNDIFSYNIDTQQLNISNLQHYRTMLVNLLPVLR